MAEEPQTVSRLGWIQRWLLAWSALYVVVGIAIRLSMKDAVPFVATIYYATPLPLITCAAVVSAFVSFRLRKRTRAVCWLIAAAVCFCWTLQHSYVHNPGQQRATDLAVVCWNTSSCDFGWSAVVETLNDLNPDIFGLVESGSTDIDAFRHWQEAFPGYELSRIEGDMVLFSRYKIAGDDFGSLGDGGYYKHVSVELDDHLLHLFLVDIKSDPLRSRRDTLEQLANVVGDTADQPTVVMGDFNTPGDSLHFGPLRRMFANAFESRGHGYAPTWPIPFPVLQLDHIWSNGHVEVSSCQASWTVRSDHRPVTVWMRPRP